MHEQRIAAEITVTLVLCEKYACRVHRQAFGENVETWGASFQGFSPFSPNIRRQAADGLRNAKLGAVEKGIRKPLNAWTTCKVIPTRHAHVPACEFQYNQHGRLKISAFRTTMQYICVASITKPQHVCSPGLTFIFTYWILSRLPNHGKRRRGHHLGKRLLEAAKRMLRLVLLALCLSSPMAFHVPSSIRTCRITRNLAVAKKMRSYETCSRSRPTSPRMVATHPLDGHIPIDTSYPGDEMCCLDVPFCAL